MAASIAQGYNIYVDGADLACYFKSWSTAKSQAEVDSTHLCNDGDMEYKPGLREATLTVEGSFDYDATNEDAINEILNAAITTGTELIMSFSRATPAAGGQVLMADGAMTSKEVNAPMGELLNASFSVKNDGALFTDGEWIAAKMDADTETLNSASLDNTASSANGGVFHAHLILESDSDATAGGTSIALQHSTDDSVWVDLVSAQTPSGTHGAVSATVTGTVNRYLRIQVITDGVAHVVGCFKRT